MARPLPARTLSRRTVLRTGGAGTLGLLLAACAGDAQDATGAAMKAMTVEART